MAFFERHTDLEYLNPQTTVNSWSSIIPDAAGHGEKFFELVEKVMGAFAIPGVVVERKEVQALRLEGRRDIGAPVVCLYVHAKDAPIGGYYHFVLARDFGKHLLLSRYMQSNLNNDVFTEFEKEEVTAYMSFVHSAVLLATKEIMGELNKDFSKINTKAEGIIDIA
jgi:hypothetical protein